MSCLHSIETLKERKVKEEVDFEAKPSEDDSLAMVGIESSEAAGPSNMAVEAVESIAAEAEVESLAMVAVERPSAKNLTISEISMMRAEYGWLGFISGKMTPFVQPTDTNFTVALRTSFCCEGVEGRRRGH